MEKKLLLAIVGGCVATLALLMTVAIVLNGDEKETLRTEGARATAEITDKYTETVSTRRSARTDHCFRLRFDAGGKAVDGLTCDFVSRALWDSVSVGSTVEVVYLEKGLTQDFDGSWSVDDVVLSQALAES